MAGDDTLTMLLRQINALLRKATVQEQQKTRTINQLVTIRTESQKKLDFYTSEIKKLQQKKSYLITFMQLYNQKKLNSEVASGFNLQEANLHKEINGLVADIVAKKYLKTNDLPQKIEELADHVDSSEQETSPLAWPSYPIAQILTIFKDPVFEKEYGFKNLSLKMAVEQGTPVYAMRDGLVYFTQAQT